MNQKNNYMSKTINKLKDIRRLFVEDDGGNTFIILPSRHTSLDRPSKIMDIDCGYDESEVYDSIKKIMNSAKEYILFPTDQNGNAIKLYKEMEPGFLFENLIKIVGAEASSDGTERQLASILMGYSRASLLEFEGSYETRKREMSYLIEKYSGGKDQNGFDSMLETRRSIFVNMIVKIIRDTSNYAIKDDRENSIFEYTTIKTKSLSRFDKDFVRNFYNFLIEKKAFHTMLNSNNEEERKFLLTVLFGLNIYDDFTARSMFSINSSFAIFINGLIKRETSDETLKKIFTLGDPVTFGSIPIMTFEVYRRNLQDEAICKNRKRLFKIVEDVLHSKMPMFPSLYKDNIKNIMHDYIDGATAESITRVIEVILSHYTDDNIVMKGCGLKQEDLFNRAYKVAKEKRALSERLSSKESFKLYYTILYGNSDINAIFYAQDVRLLRDSDISTPENKVMSMFTVLKNHDKFSKEFVSEIIKNAFNSLVGLPNHIRQKFIKFISFFIHSDLFNHVEEKGLDEIITIFIKELSKSSLRAISIEKIIIFSPYEYNWSRVWNPQQGKNILFGKDILDFMQIVLLIDDRRKEIDSAVLKNQLS
jgi:hypothetical protein